MWYENMTTSWSLKNRITIREIVIIKNRYNKSKRTLQCTAIETQFKSNKNAALKWYQTLYRCIGTYNCVDWLFICALTARDAPWFVALLLEATCFCEGQMQYVWYLPIPWPRIHLPRFSSRETRIKTSKIKACNDHCFHIRISLAIKY